MIKHNLEREKTEDYELMQKISEDKGKKLKNTHSDCRTLNLRKKGFKVICNYMLTFLKIFVY